jgi:primary-amine oxidase
MAAPDNVPSFPAPRTDLKPISITQPAGASYTVTGHHVA